MTKLIYSDYSHRHVQKRGDYSIRIKKYFVQVLFTMVFFASNAFAQLAPVNPPAGGFAIDGGLRANTPSVATPSQPWLAANQGDWYPSPSGVTGTGGSVFNNANSPLNSATSGRGTDPFNSSDNVFTTGSKFNDYVEDLRWFTNSAPD
ncbi:MAG: hypothetical protein WKF91_21350, partial [Segetibacter sp.]